MARSVWDCAAMLNVMVGADPGDRTTVDRPPVDYLAGLGRGVDGLTIGLVANDNISAHSHPTTMAVLRQAVDDLVAAGAVVEPVELPLYEEASVGAFVALQAEAFAWHRSTLIDRWDDYGRPTRLTIAQGALISAGDLVQIERVRHRARAGIADVMRSGSIDLLVSPTTGYGATPFSGADPAAIARDALHTPAWNSCGFPALSVPMGFDDDGLPLGLQIIGLPFADDLVLAAGHAYQQVTDHHRAVAPNHR
jgi:aspartyl-tRNA(Asn)/glutamyl-tRNA(Gln) amidotransferase subunit A